MSGISFAQDPGLHVLSDRDEKEKVSPSQSLQAKRGKYTNTYRRKVIE